MLKLVTISTLSLICIGWLAREEWFAKESAQPATVTQLEVDPHNYYGKRVRLSGTVVSSAGLFDRGAYRLRDDGGSEIMVVSARHIPPVGLVVTVEGELHQGLIVNSAEYQVLAQDGDYTSGR